MKILIDMNIPLAYGSFLAKKGIEVMRWSEVGKPNATDTEIMSYARNNDYSVLTCDLDFSAILSITRELKPSVIQIRSSIHQAEQAAELIAVAITKYAEDINKGAILSINLRGARLRLLPL